MDTYMLRILGWMYCALGLTAVFIAALVGTAYLVDEVSGWFALLFLLGPVVLMAGVVAAYEIAVWLGLEP